MARLEDLVSGLRSNGDEIQVPKKEVTDGLEGWEPVFWYMPKLGCRASYRKGRLHALDMGTYYSVHRDLVDPKKDKIGHLVKDAPEVLVAGAVVGCYFGWRYYQSRKKRNDR